jgi:hypothetical protein
MSINRNPTGKGGFRKGQSGNPGGRPAVSGELRALARERTPEAMNVLTEIMRDPKTPAAALVSACRELLDRGYGRPDSSVNARIEEVTPEPDLENLTDAELVKWQALEPVLNKLYPNQLGQRGQLMRQTWPTAPFRRFGCDESTLAGARRYMAGDYNAAKLAASEVQEIEATFCFYERIVGKLIRGKNLLLH